METVGKAVAEKKEPLCVSIELMEEIPAVAIGSEIKVTVIGKLTYMEQGSRYPGEAEYRKAKGEIRIEPTSIKVSESQENAFTELLREEED